MLVENITLLEFVNKHFKHYDVILKKEDYDSLEIRVKGAKTGRMIIRRTSPYDIIHNAKHQIKQRIHIIPPYGAQSIGSISIHHPALNQLVSGFDRAL